MKVVIIEDEPLAAGRLSDLICEIRKDFEILAILPSVEKSIDWLKSNTPDLIFLDISLSDGSSFNIFDVIKKTIPIIFTTAYDKYAINAFKLNSIDYLLKPVSKQELENAIIKYESIYSSNDIDLKAFFEKLYTNAQEYKRKFLVQTGNKIKSIQSENIALFYAEEKAVYLLTKQGNKYICDHTLDKLEKSLSPEVFFRINRKVIINFDSIVSMESYSRGRVIVEINPKPPSGIDTIVSIDRSTEFKSRLDK